MGLIGALYGISDSLWSMSEQVAVIITFLAAEIAQALVSTAAGLAVSAFAVWLFNYFTGKVDKFAVEMNNYSAEIIEFLIKQRGRK